MSKRIQVPWEFSKSPEPGRGVPTVPTDEGAKLGEHLALFCDIEEERRTDLSPEQTLRCDECAFRKGTLPNGSPQTLMDAVKCIFEGEPFYCHKGVKDGAEPRRLCGGFVLLSTAGKESADV